MTAQAYLSPLLSTRGLPRLVRFLLPVELFDQSVGGRALLLKARRGLLGVPHHTQNVQPRELLDVLIAPAAPQELGEKDRVVVDAFETDRDRGDAVEVRAEADKDPSPEGAIRSPPQPGRNRSSLDA